MKKNKDILKHTALVVLVFLLSLMNSFGQVKFTAQLSKNKVTIGEVFQIAFTLNTNGTNFKAPSFSDFDVYSGPNQSTNMQYVNGQMSQSITLSYFIAARKEGKFTIGPASALVNGQKMETNSVTVEVGKGNSPGNQNNSAQRNNPNSNNPQQEEEPQYSSAKSDDDLFVRTFVSKKSCYLGEQIIVTQKVYSRLNLRGFQNYKLPAYNGFWSQEEDRKKQINLETENLDGISYYVAEFNKTYLFPQRAGSITIDPVEIDCIVRKRSNKKPQNIFEQFFGGGGYEDALVKIKSKPVSIEVKQLPEAGKPEGFGGAVGNFNFKAELNREKVKANESVNLKITISGRGNIKLVDAPKVNFPESFETYDPKTSENYSANGGVSGSKTYDYLIIPRQKGEFVLNNLNFSYFDPEKKQYVSIPTPDFKITVTEPDAGTTGGAQVYIPKNTIDQKENDIRYIKTGDLHLKPVNEEFFSSWKHYTLMALPLFLFFGFVIGRNAWIKQNSNIAAVKERRAAKFAKKQLTLANKFKTENKKDEFYNELFIALNTYVSHKLSIPVSDLTKENIQKSLLAKQVKPETVSMLIGTINDCEFARYAPGAASPDLNSIYTNTVKLITNIEDEIKA
ncbi:MAG: BatD family protein [Bacteroidia bacterium]